MSRYIVAYWIESASPYLVIDTQPDTDGVADIVGAFTRHHAETVAKALNAAGQLEACESEMRRMALVHEQARAKWAEQRTGGSVMSAGMHEQLSADLAELQAYADKGPSVGRVVCGRVATAFSRLIGDAPDS